MCVLSVATSGIRHDREDLEAACWNNPDGFGYAIHTGRHILRRRSMDSESIIDRYMEDRIRYPNGPALFHARIATSGKVDNSGCHPFTLPNNAKVAIGHNGVLPLNMAKIGGWKSDTRYFVEDIVRDVDALSIHDLVKIEEWMGSGNKLAILSADRRLPPFTILNEKAGHWANGIWWSNHSYTWSNVKHSSYLWGEVWEKTDGEWWRKKESTDGTSNKDIVPSVLRKQEGPPASILWDDPDCPWCDRPLTEEMLDNGQCDHCLADLLDEEHVDSAFCACYQCKMEYEEELSTFAARFDRESSF
jgi:hypothetical protein